MDKEIEDRFVELASRIEVLETMVDRLSDNILKLESILNDIAEQIIPEDE